MKEYFEKQRNVILSKKDLIVPSIIFTVIFLLFAHVYLLVNDIRNHDSLLFNGYGAGITSGRWALQFMGETVDKIWGGYNIPFFNTAVSLILITIISVLLILIFDINKKVNAIFISGIFVVFPSLTATLIYTFTAHYYIFAILLVFIATYIIDESKISFIISTLLVAFAIGIYQAYLPFYISLLCLKSINDCIKGEDFKDILKRGIKYLVSIVLSLVIYMIILKIVLAITGLTLSSYRNIDTMGSVGVFELLRRMLIAYVDIVRLPFHMIFSVNKTLIIKFSILILYIVSFIMVIFTLKKMKEKKLKLLFLALILVLPFALNSSVIMASRGYTYSLMSYTLVFIFILPLLFLDKYDFDIKLIKVSNMVTYSILTLAIINYIWSSNGNYLALKTKMSYAEHYYNRLISRIESTEGYIEGRMIALVGEFSDKSEVDLWRNPDLSFNYDINTDTFLRENIRLTFIKNFVGKKIHIVSNEDAKKLAKRKEVREMPPYPYYGSVKQIDNVMVVRLRNIDNLFEQ
ncbi:glucosyltransferase domain-containing protein [Helcococcus kunzii]|uniref:Glucosyl transferase GtrII n=1 Tax=Helcococcus kunzii ATCC 51366 TaxID=883114 RepID=H3NLG0_9FIRM|nr:glucosyltransferase domain-containing protein [Helcococcus kunzii]EHR36041.1 hypothetical protein HMPREF9709_00137 [Helcococcus kunzii ATCC 51366]